MRKSGWAAAAGLGSLVLLLTACGGSSGSTSSSSSTPAATATAPAGGQPTSGALGSLPPRGSIVLTAQSSNLGYVLAETDGQVLYVYSKDTKGSAPTCTGSCAAIWLPVTGNPVASQAATGLGHLGTVSDANGAKQITYNGMPLYTYKGAKSLSTAGNGIGGVWHVIKLSRSNVVGG